MTTRAKENLLHRIIAGSAFVFALCILPVAQYALVGRQSGGSADQQGQVAGVSTDQSITEQDVAAASPTPDPNSCAARDQQVAGLQQQIDAWHASFSAWQSDQVSKRDQQITDLPSTLSSDEYTQQAQAIRDASNQEVVNYAASVDKAVASLSSQKELAASRSCLAE